MSNSLRPHVLYSPWNSPGQNTGVGSLSLLQGIFPTRGSNPGLLHCWRFPRGEGWSFPSSFAQAQTWWVREGRRQAGRLLVRTGLLHKGPLGWSFLFLLTRARPLGQVQESAAGRGVRICLLRWGRLQCRGLGARPLRRAFLGLEGA